MKPSEVTEIVALLAEAYPNAKLREHTVEVYETMLRDLDFELSKRAAARLIGTCKYFPTVAEIRAAVTDLRLGPVRDGCEAWTDVTSEIRRVGYMGRPRFSDPVVANIIDRWGWRTLCCDGSDVADRARFIEMYDAMASRGRQDEASGIALPEPRQNHPRIEGATLLRLADGIGKGRISG